MCTCHEQPVIGDPRRGRAGVFCAVYPGKVLHAERDVLDGVQLGSRVIVVENAEQVAEDASLPLCPQSTAFTVVQRCPASSIPPQLFEGHTSTSPQTRQRLVKEGSRRRWQR